MGWMEEYQKLKAALAEADREGLTANPQAFRLVLLQTLGSFETLAASKRKEQERLREELAAAKALEGACLRMVQVVAEQIDGLVRAKRRSTAEVGSSQETTLAPSAPPGSLKAPRRVQRMKADLPIQTEVVQEGTET